MSQLKSKRFTFEPIVFLLLCATFYALPCHTQIFGGLKAKIQKELDANPFLKKEGVKLRVVEEESGYVTIDMCEGSRAVREEIDKGHDIIGDGLTWQGNNESQRKTVTVIRRAISYVQKIDGIKEILLSASVNTPQDKGEDAFNEKDYEQALTWYRKAADQGNASAQVSIGYMYALGHGVPQDYEQALAWYRKAADQGSALAQSSIGTMYDRGHGVPQDYEQALAWYRKAADQGSALAQSSIGTMYVRGQGVPQDYEQALVWYRKAADQGLYDAQNAIGLMYCRGHGVQQDYERALNSFRKAADQGGPRGYNGLAWFFATCREARYRDGERAVSFAKKAVAEDKNVWYFRGTLAAAYARNGQFDLAVDAQEAALTLLRKDALPEEKKNKWLADAQKRLELYKNNTAYVEEGY